MTTDLRHLSSTKSKKAPKNVLKKKKEPVDLRKYILPLVKYGWKIALVILIVAVVIASGKALLARSTFTVRSIEVHGTKRIKPSEIVALSGIKPGQDLLGVKLKGIGQLVATNPWVATAKVQRFFPGTVSITVTERQPIAVINMGLLYYLDENGEPFKPLSQGDSLDYPVITGISEEELATGGTTTKQALKTASELISALKTQGTFILADISEIHYDRIKGFILYTTDGSTPIKIGSEKFGEKLQRFAKVYGDLKSQTSTVQLIDLDYADRIIVNKQ